MNQESSPSKRYAEITFRKAGQAYLFSSDQIDVKERDKVIVETEQGTALGSVKRIYDLTQSPPPSLRIFPIMRIATTEEIERSKYHRLREKEAFRFCRERIVVHKLPMKMVRTEHLFSGSKMIFYFSAEGRIDFRDLVRDLARHFRMRIEMRQIGVRDSAKLIGGAGPCGQELCCSRFLRNFSPVSIRMAKDQSLALNPQKVSGVCGRLMCCLSYEQSMYKQLRRSLPKIGRDVETPEGIGKVREVHPLRESVRVVFLDREPVVEKEFHVADLPEYKDAFAKEIHPSEAETSEPVKKVFDFADFDNFDDRGQARIKGRRGIEPLMEPRNLPYPLPPFDDDEDDADDDDDTPRLRRRPRGPAPRPSRPPAPQTSAPRRDARSATPPKEREPQQARRERTPPQTEKTRPSETSQRPQPLAPKTRILDIHAKGRPTKPPRHPEKATPSQEMLASSEGLSSPVRSSEESSARWPAVSREESAAVSREESAVALHETAKPHREDTQTPDPRSLSPEQSQQRPPQRLDRRVPREDRRVPREDRRVPREDQRHPRSEEPEAPKDNSPQHPRRVLRSDGEADRRGMRSDSPTDRRGMRSDSPTDRRGMRSDGEADRRGMRSDSPTDRRGMRSDGEADRRGMRSDSPTDRRGMRSDSPTDRRGMRGDSTADRRGMRSDSTADRRGMRSDGTPEQRETRGGSDERRPPHSAQRGSRHTDGNARDADGNTREPNGNVREPNGNRQAFDARERRGSRGQEDNRQRPPQGRVGKGPETDGTHAERRSASERWGRSTQRPNSGGNRATSHVNETNPQGEGGARGAVENPSHTKGSKESEKGSKDQEKGSKDQT